MAQRKIFYTDMNAHVQVANVNFKWQRGFNRQAMKISDRNLLHAFYRKYRIKPLEISSLSNDHYGNNASAFNLRVKTSHGIYRMEQLFQAGKVFQDKQGNLHSLQKSLTLAPAQAKHRARYWNSHAQLHHFGLFGSKFGLEPKTYFYDWTYLHGLMQHPKLAQHILNHHAFSDIFAKGSINTQAKSCALYTALHQNFGSIGFKKLMRNKSAFKKIESKMEKRLSHPHEIKETNMFSPQRRTKQWQSHGNQKNVKPKFNPMKDSQNNAQQLNLFQQNNRQR